MSLYYDGPRFSVPQYYYDGDDLYECGEIIARRNEANREAKLEAAMYKQEEIEARKAYGFLCHSNTLVCVGGPKWVEFCSLVW